jgi:curved DNA-binding protein CbpA
MVAEDSAPLSGPLVEVLRGAYLQRRSGRCEVAGGPIGSIYLRRGEIYLDRDQGGRSGELLGLAGPLRAGTQAGGGRQDGELRQAMEKLGRDFAGVAGQATFRSNAGGAVELVGPLPTVFLLLELATAGASERQLVDRLGGEQTRFRGHQETPALQQLAGLDSEMVKAMMVVDQSGTLGDHLRSAAHRQQLLRGLVKLWAVGLLAIEQPAAAPAGQNAIVTPKALQRFRERIGENLEDQPMTLGADAHRAAVAGLFGRLAKVNFYELLEIKLDASDEQILSGFNQLARLVHPQHAAKLGLQGREDTLQVLFERVTEAYLTLSDPVRRSSYNTLMGLHQDIQIRPEQRVEEKRRMARVLYNRGTDALATMDYSTAVDLLKEAARMDPQAGYYAALGQAQAKNPNWRKHAVESYERAIELDKTNAGLYVAFGQVLEQLGETARSKQQFDQALTLMPNHPAALDGLARLQGGGKPAAAAKSSLKSALGWGKR